MLIQTISIHALCEEGDNNINKSTRPLEISIHALCEEGDCTAFSTNSSSRLFLSTPSARRATERYSMAPVFRAISIHALCEEGDAPTQAPYRVGQNFYPRPLRGGRLSVVNWLTRCVVISIHALCEEGDALHLLLTPVRWNFYPRPLRGGRRANPSPLSSGTEFLSTPSARRATVAGCKPIHLFIISIHALCEEGDGGGLQAHSPFYHFYPRPLRGGRHIIA